MKYSIKQFANEIRQKYPNSYDDLSDQKLIELWVKKHPDDKNKIRNEKIDFEKWLKEGLNEGLYRFKLDILDYEKRLQLNPRAGGKKTKKTKKSRKIKSNKTKKTKKSRKIKTKQ